MIKSNNNVQIEDNSTSMDNIHVMHDYLEVFKGLVHECASENPTGRKIFERIASELPEEVEQDILESIRNPNAGLHLLKLMGYSPEDGVSIPSSGVNVFSLSDALQPLEPQTWIIDPLISQGSLSIVVGAAGSMKTYLMLDAALNVAAGNSWLGHKTTQVPTLYLDEENGYRRIIQRVQELKNGEDLLDTIPFFFTTMEGFNLTDGSWVEKLRNIITEKHIGFVCIDSLVDVFVGIDENSAQATNTILRELNNVAKELNTAIVLIHHKNKGGEYRGSSSLLGGVDLMLEVSKNRKTENLNVSIIKSRDIDDNYAFSVMPIFRQGNLSLQRGNAGIKVSAMQEDVLSVITSTPNITTKMIVEKLTDKSVYLSQISKSETPIIGKQKLRDRIRKEITDLIAHKVVVRTDGGCRGSEGTYSIAPKSLL